MSDAYAKFRNNLKIISLLIMVHATGCAVTRNRVSDLKEVSSDEVVLVGRFILDPPLSDFEKNTLSGFSGKIFFRVSGDAAKIKPEFSLYDKSLLSALENRTFTVKTIRHEALVLNGAYAVISSGDGNSMTISFPIHAEIQVPPHQRFVYVGDLRLQRDRFSRLKGLKLQDGFAQAKKDFAGEFGSEVGLEKNLWTGLGL